MLIIKLVALIMGCLFILIIGEIIKTKFKKKYLYVSQLITILNRIKTEMIFSKKFINEIIHSQIDMIESELKIVFIEYIENKNFNIGFFDITENNDLNNFFNNLGESDIDNEIIKINYTLTLLEEMRIKYKNKFLSNGVLAYKMSICLSLAFLIMFA